MALGLGSLFKQNDLREAVHFLHIGKNAGTQLKLICDQINECSEVIRIVKHSHKSKLTDLPEGSRFFFSVRDPIRRFVSGFYSRKRKGQPRIYVEWSEGERAAFTRFEHANDLAEALFEPTPAGVEAFAAMRSIGHVSEHQFSWFGDSGYFLGTRPPVHIVRQERFQSDLDALLRKLGVDFSVAIEKDATRSHKNSYENVPDLSEQAVRNLQKWYAIDIEFYRICSDWLESSSGAAPFDVQREGGTGGAL